MIDRVDPLEDAFETLKREHADREVFDEAVRARLLARGRARRSLTLSRTRWLGGTIGVLLLSTAAAAGGASLLHDLVVRTRIGDEEVDARALVFDEEGNASYTVAHARPEGATELAFEVDVPCETEPSGPVALDFHAAVGESTTMVEVQRQFTSPLEASEPDDFTTRPAVGAHRFLDGKGPARVPFELHNGDIVMTVEVNGTPLRLALDNGSMSWDALLLYGSPRLDPLALDLEGEVTIGGAGGGAGKPAAFAPDVNLRLPGVEITGQPVIVTDRSSGFAEMFPGEDGIICGSLFWHFVVRIDFEEMVLVLTEPARFEASGEGITLPMTRVGKDGRAVPATVELEDGTRRALQIGLDLGGINSLLLFTDAEPPIPLPADARPRHLGAGVQGEITGKGGRIPALELGSYVLLEVPTGFTSHTIVRGVGDEGMLGLPLLGLFHMTYDYRRGELTLEPTAIFDEHGVADLSEHTR